MFRRFLFRRDVRGDACVLSAIMGPAIQSSTETAAEETIDPEVTIEPVIELRAAA